MHGQWACRANLLVTSSPLPAHLADRAYVSLQASAPEVMLDENDAPVLDDLGRPIITSRREEVTVTAYASFGGLHFYPRYLATRDELVAAGYALAPEIEPQDHLELTEGRPLLTLRPGGQELAYAGALEQDGGFVVLGTGRGKTVTALRILCEWGKPTIAVFYNGGHLQQWAEEIQKKLGIEAGICTGPFAKWDWKGRAIVLTTYHSYVPALTRGELTEAFQTYFGAMVWDEAHHAAAPVFGASVTSLPVRRLALSATPGSDGREKLLYLHIGQPVVWDTSPDLVPDCYFVPAKTKRSSVAYKPGDMRAYGREAGRVLGTAREDTDPEYLTALVQRIEILVKSGRTVLVHCIRTRVIECLRARIPEAAVIDQRVPFEMRPRILRSSQVVLLSAKIGEEALDRPEADTVILTFPLGKESVSRLQQASGRVLRLHPKGEKQVPQVWVFYPSNAYGYAQARANEELLRGIGFNIKVATQRPR